MHKLYTSITGNVVPKASIGDNRNRPRGFSDLRRGVFSKLVQCCTGMGSILLKYSPKEEQSNVVYFTLISNHVFEHDPYHTGIGFNQFPILDNWILSNYPLVVY